MFVLFIDVLRDLDKDYRLYTYSNAMHLIFNKEFINIERNKKLDKIKFKFFEFVIKYKLRIKKIDSLALVFSDNIEKLEIKENIICLLNKSIKNVYEVKKQNQMELNYKKYLDSYVHINNLRIDDIRILYFLDSFNDIAYKNILENINRFKYIDICYTADINSYDYEQLANKINYINIELGSVIEFVKCDFNNYNVYFNFTCELVKQKYNIKSDALIIDWYFTRKDNLNENNIILKNNYFSLDKILKKLYCDIDNYDSTKLGLILKNNMIFK